MGILQNVSNLFGNLPSFFTSTQNYVASNGLDPFAPLPAKPAAPATVPAAMNSGMSATTPITLGSPGKINTGPFLDTTPGATNANQAAAAVNIPKLVDAIKYNESRGEKSPYSFAQPSGSSTLGRALGAYQITEGELKTYAKKYLGFNITPQQFLANPQLQDQYMQSKANSLSSRGLNVQQIMAVHRYGGSDLTPEGLAKVSKAAAQYIQSGMQRYNQ